jgi:sugar lactone lactonase YvrE
MSHAVVLAGPPAELGEGAVWDDERSQLMTIDMIGGTLCKSVFSSASVDHDFSTVGDFIGAAMPASWCDVVIVTMHGLAAVEGERTRELVTILDDPSLRLNDAACDSSGRVWVGSTALDNAQGRGSLWVHGPDGTRLAATGLTLPNGVGWSPDDATLYLADSGQGVVLRADFDASAGTIGALERFASIEGGAPDGLCVGEDGSLWIAVWDGARIDRISAEGVLIESVELPVRRPTSCALVPGEGLVITTARLGLNEAELEAEPLAGRLFLHPTAERGVASGRVAPL